MRLSNLVAQWLRPQQTKNSAAGPMIAWSHVGQPQWTPRRMQSLAEEGFRKNVIAYRCVMHIATASAGVPWLLYDEDGQELDSHPLLTLMAHPNPLQDGVGFMENIYANLQIFGNAYIEAIRPNDAAAPIELYALRPDRMKVVPGATGLPQGYQYTVNGQVTTWPADPLTGASNILHLKQYHPLDDWYGLAPMEAALQSIDQHNASGAWNQALLNQGARPSGALVYAPKDGPATLTDDQLQRLREEMGQLYQGDRNAGRPLILEGGLEWREMSLSPKDMDWLSGRNNAARDISLAFGVPAQLVGIPDAQTYANMEQARLAFYEETVLPLVTRVASGIDHWLCPMYRQRLELDFDIDSISALTDKRQSQWSKVQGANFLTLNEKRDVAGYGPIADGDRIDTRKDENDGSKSAVRPKYSPSQPRVPAGCAEGGQWCDGEGSESGKPIAPGENVVQETERYPTSSITNREEADRLVRETTGYIGQNDQCASLTHALSPELPPTPEWIPGDLVQGNADIPIGTPIATFNFQNIEGTNGYGPPNHLTGESGQSHTGIYLGQDSSGIYILHQWGGHKPRISHIRWNAWGQNEGEGGSRYYTIDY